MRIHPLIPADFIHKFIIKFNGLKYQNHYCSSLGDEIVAINGRMLDGLRHAEAIGIFKSIKCGKIVLQVSRRQKKDQR